MQPHLLLEAVDVRRSSVAGSSRATTIAKMVLPPVRFKRSTRSAGGGVMDVSFVQARIEAIEPTFSVMGIDTDIFADIGERGRWDFAASMRNKKTGARLPLRATIEGTVAEWTPDESDPAEFLGCNQALHEVTHYELSLNNEELWYIDDDERVIRRKGRDLFAAVRAALGA